MPSAQNLNNVVLGFPLPHLRRELGFRITLYILSWGLEVFKFGLVGSHRLSRLHSSTAQATSSAGFRVEGLAPTSRGLNH